jgi:hypothetical protein
VPSSAKKQSSDAAVDTGYINAMVQIVKVGAFKHINLRNQLRQHSSITIYAAAVFTF